MSKTREILNSLNLAYEMEYMLRVNDASEPDWAVRFFWEETAFHVNCSFLRKCDLVLKRIKSMNFSSNQCQYKIYPQEAYIYEFHIKAN